MGNKTLNEAVDFRLFTRIYIEDTDVGGVVYHANYLKYFERARSDWLGSLGISQRTLFEENCQFVVASCHIDYLKPALLNDLLEVTLKVERLRGVSIDFSQQAIRNGEVLCRAKVKVASISNDTKKPLALPEQLLQKLTSS